jgi:hypothetical protein
MRFVRARARFGHAPKYWQHGESRQRDEKSRARRPAGSFEENLGNHGRETTEHDRGARIAERKAA